VRRKLREQWR